MTPAVAYLRMSSDKQDTSIPAQRDAIARLAKSGRFRIVREYVDAGISGDDTTRRVEFLNDGDCDFVVGHHTHLLGFSMDFNCSSACRMSAAWLR